MNKTRREMLEVLKRLRDEHNTIAIKAEFEAEGSRTDELVMLNETVCRADMKLYVKIGGCEAVRDLDQCRLLGAGGIMAPMIETPFAMEKFRQAASKVYGNEIDDVEWIINSETITCYENLDAILEKGKGFLNTVVTGRVDFSASMDISRKEINSPNIYKYTEEISRRVRDMGYIAGVGGGISFDAIPFLVKIAPYIDKFETRKVVMKPNNDEKSLREAILCAMEFETLYLQNKCQFYDRMAKEDEARMVMLKKRVEAAKAAL